LRLLPVLGRREWRHVVRAGQPLRTGDAAAFRSGWEADLCPARICTGPSTLLFAARRPKKTYREKPQSVAGFMGGGKGNHHEAQAQDRPSFGNCQLKRRGGRGIGSARRKQYCPVFIGGPCTLLRQSTVVARWPSFPRHSTSEITIVRASSDLWRLTGIRYYRLCAVRNGTKAKAAGRTFETLA